MSERYDPRRQQAGIYPARFGHRILYSDMDANRHLNNGATGRYLEEGRACVNMKIFGVACMVDPPPGQQILFATVTIDFLRQAHYPGEVEIATGAVRVGTTSYVLAQAAFQDGACFALAEAVMVEAMDGRPTPLSGEERAVIATLMLAA